jgi:hypothetical protein
VPVPENDSDGELIYLVAEIMRYTADRALAAELWPRVLSAARHIDQLRRSERSPANQTAERRAQWGLLPPSISHEGYSSKPAYSYWDNFWAIAGLRNAAWLAEQLGDTAAAAQLAGQCDELTHDVIASIRTSAAAHHVAYIPGAADLGDFDATSTTIALSPGGALDFLPADQLRATFERAWQTLVDRDSRRDSRHGSQRNSPRASQPGAQPAAERDPRPDRSPNTPPGDAPASAEAPSADDAYTPYELRLVGAFLRLGWRDRAIAALALYLADRRPADWNQWAEVVGADPRAPRFLGDMPHAWVHSDYARSVLDLFAYERDRDHAWLLAAGIPADWFTGDGFAIDRLPTPFGSLSYAVTATRDAITLRIGPGATPPGGLVLPYPWPWPSPAASAGRATPPPARIDGVPTVWRIVPGPAGTAAAPELAIDHRPATIALSRGDSGAP